MGKKTKNTITILCVGLLFWSTTGVFANDCELITNSVDITQTQAYQSFTTNIKGTINMEGVLTSEAISRALINLKKACCTSQTINRWWYCEWFKEKTKFPNSVYFFDHLVDIQLRRLDGESYLAYGEKVDQAGKERRTFIKWAAETKNWEITAKEMTEQRGKYRKRKYVYDKIWDKELQEIAENYTQFTLADRYYITCDLVNKILSLGRNIRINEVYQKKCTTMIQQRVEKEKNYTNAVIMKKSNDLLHSTTRAYIQTYITENKTMTLLSLVNKIKSLFSTMVQQAATKK